MAAMCGRCARKLQHLRIPWHRSLSGISPENVRVTALCTASSKSSSEEVDDEISDVQSLFTSPAKRDPMAVLRALASTVQPNPALPNPDFIEDIFLLPKAKFKQAECLLAKKSGQEAAKYVISKCPEIFPLRKPNPMWETQDVTIDIADVQTEEQLKGFIKTRNAKNAVQAYERLKEQGVKVSLETQNELLDLAAHHLGNISAEETLKPLETGSSFISIETKEEKPDTDDGDSSSDSDEEFDDEARNEEIEYSPAANRWKKGNYAEQMFESMTTKDGSTYEAMVLGLVKHNSGSKAYELFKEMRETGHQVSVMTYYLMFMGIARCGDVENKWEKAQNLVKSMGEEPIVLPNLRAFNSLIRVAAVCSDGDKPVTQLALGLIREMLAIGIEPSLESFNQILRAEYLPIWEERKRAKSMTEQKAKAIGNPSVLDMVITHLESLPKLPPLSDPRDTAFFHSAMSVAFICVDANLAIRIYNLLKKQNNTAFLGKKHSPFYSAFLMTLAGAEFHFPLLFEYYKEIVPEKLRPRDHVYSALFNLVNRTKTPGLVPKLYEDMRMNQVGLTKNVTTAMFRALSVTDKPEDLKVHLDIMVDVLYWMKIFNLQPSPFVISRAITMYCKNGKLLEAWRMLDMFEKHDYPPSYTALHSVLMLAAEQMDQFKVVRCFEMLSKFGYSFGSFRRRHLYNQANIPRSESKRIDGLFKDIGALDDRRRKYEKGEHPDALDPKASDFPWDSTKTS